MNNKLLLVIACICITFLSCAQESSDLRTQLELLQEQPESGFTTDSTGFAALKDPIFYSKQGYTDAFIINGKNVHFVDFNNDEQKDIIYQDTQYRKATTLFARKGDHFVEIWSGLGKIVHITQDAQTSIYVLSKAISCLKITMLFSLKVSPDNTVNENSIARLNQTKIDNIPSKFEVIKVTGILRTQPVVDDQLRADPCTGDSKTGNQIRGLKEISATVIQKKEGWMQVVCDVANGQIIGWIQTEN